MKIADFITPVEHVLLKFQLDTIKLIEIKNLQDLNYIKRTRNMQENLKQKIEELSNKVEELTRAMETLILKKLNRFF